MARSTALQYIGVAPCVPLGARGKEWYTYSARHDDAVKVGSVVRAPFGKQAVYGVVMECNLQRPSYPTKMIQTVTTVVLTDLQMQFARFIADSAHGGFGFTARLFLPNSFSGINTPREKRRIKKKTREPIVIIEKDTLVRMKAVRSSIRKVSGQTLILVPELVMLKKYEELFHKEIQNHAAAIYHAGLSTKEKKEIWQKVALGELQIIIGTQKALFLPFNTLVCVCIDEEYIETYKLWDQYPRLDTVMAADRLAHYAYAQLLYASSYPSLRLRYAIEKHGLQPMRNNPTVPIAEVYGFSFEDRKWKRSVPDELSRPIRAWARSGKRVLVLHNKKDHAPVRTSLLGKLSKKAVNNITISTVGIFSDELIEPFDEVVWLQPELTLRSIDYRSNERARMLIARLLTISRSKTIYVAARYAEFVREQLGLSEDEWLASTLKDRKRFLLPPYADMVRLTIRDKKDKAASKRAEDVRGMLDECIQGKNSIRVYGPYQELGARKKDVCEYQVLLTGLLDDLVPLYKDLPIDAADVIPHRVV